ncbi:hypothetical protein A6C57_01215 [Fibrella sp. ES10-3-2-2]|nr:hypothetical protein A6C57_01215 [Fibrella sp. ES10-3-2-2]
MKALLPLLILLLLAPMAQAQTKSIAKIAEVNGTFSYTLVDGTVRTVSSGGGGSGDYSAVTASLAAKATAKTVSLTNATTGTTITHNLGTSAVLVLFKRSGANLYDFAYTWSVVSVNAISLITPYSSSGIRELFTGEVTIITTTN